MRVEEKQEQRYSEMKEEKQIEGKERQKAWNKNIERPTTDTSDQGQ